MLSPFNQRGIEGQSHMQVHGEVRLGSSNLLCRSSATTSSCVARDVAHGSLASSSFTP